MRFKSLRRLCGKIFGCLIFKGKLWDDKDDDEDNEDDEDDDEDDDHHAGQGSVESHKETPFPCFVPEELQDRIQYESRLTKILHEF